MNPDELLCELGTCELGPAEEVEWKRIEQKILHYLKVRFPFL